jgi:YtkA-like
VQRSAYFRPRILAVSCATALLLVGCSSPTDTLSLITVEHTVSPDPPRVGASTIILKLTDRGAKPVSGATIKLEADMSHPGMAPVFAAASEMGPGLYQADLKFAMAGDWVVLLHVRMPGGQTLEHQFKISSVRPN